MINWTRGLLRLWLVGSLLWAVPVGWIMWPQNAVQDWAVAAQRSRALTEELQNNPFARFGPPAPGSVNAARVDELTMVEYHLDQDRVSVGVWALCTLAPPLAVLLIGTVLWALRGFRRTP